MCFSMLVNRIAQVGHDPVLSMGIACTHSMHIMHMLQAKGVL